MKMNLRKQLFRMTRWTLYGLVAQCLFANLLLAWEGNTRKGNIYRMHIDASSQQKNRNIHLSLDRTEEAPTAAISESEYEQVQVSGTVTDKETGEPLISVNILIKGTTSGTTTDVNGRYSILVNKEDVLIFSFIGYKTQEVPVGDRTVIDVALAPDVERLQEVVVVGYGTQKRKELTGSIVSVSQENIDRLPLTSIDQKLQGQVAGMQVTQTSGNPGGGVVMRIRGAGTIGNNQPLFVIDGFPIGSDFDANLNPLSTINPNDIASIEVLKDASATAIYGSRGANGVVIITTKRGSVGKPKVELNMTTGMQYLPKKIPLLNAEEMVELYKEARQSTYIERKPANVSLEDWLAVPANSPARGVNRIFPYFDRPSSEFGAGTDWQDEIFRPAPMNLMQLNVSGGTDNVRYLVSGELTDQQGIVIESWFKRYSFRANVEADLSKKLKVGLNVTPSYAQSRIANTQGHFNAGSIITAALAMSPTIPVYNEDGSYGQQIGRTDINLATVFNPVALAREIFRYHNSGRVLGNSFLEFAPIENLIFRTSVGVDFVNSRVSTFNTSRWGTQAPQPPTANASSANDISWLNENTLTYNLRQGAHSINAVVGFTAQKFDNNSMFVSRSILPNDLLPYVVGPADGGNTSAQQWSLLSYLGRVNYTFKDRYLLTATMRRDGSSRFGRNSKWGTFPSAAIGWIVSEENFMKGISAISELKLRASYGATGNFEIGNYESFALMSSSQYVGGVGLGQFTDAFLPSTIANPDLTWETSYKTDIGFDLGLFKNRLRITADYYRNLTKDMLLSVAIPATSGFLSARQNVGSIENKGVELALNYTIINKSDFQWNGNFNISYNKNTVLSLGDFGDRIFGAASRTAVAEFTITQVGHPLGSFFGHIHDGIFRTQAEVDAYVNADGQKMQQRARPGDVRWRDVDGDGRITVNDRTIIGSPMPDYIFGMTHTITFKNWDFSVLFSGTQGNHMANLPLRFMTNMNGNLNQHAMMRDRWRSETNQGRGDLHRASQNPNQPIVGQTDAFTAMPQNPDRFSSFYVEDASFIRLRNLVIGYSLPQNLLTKLHLQKARFYFTGTNLLTLTKYRGYDPETNEQGNSATSQGVDAGGYPQPRTVLMGLNLMF